MEIKDTTKLKLAFTAYIKLAKEDDGNEYPTSTLGDIMHMTGLHVCICTALKKLGYITKISRRGWKTVIPSGLTHEQLYEIVLAEGSAIYQGNYDRHRAKLAEDRLKVKLIDSIPTDGEKLPDDTVLTEPVVEEEEVPVVVPSNPITPVVEKNDSPFILAIGEDRTTLSIGDYKVSFPNGTAFQFGKA